MARSLLSMVAMGWATAILLFLSLPLVAIAGDGEGLVPTGPLSDALAFVDGNRPADAIKALQSYRPDMAGLGAYHYVFARASSASRNQMEAAAHYRRSYVYASDAGMKETSLFLAAETEYGMEYFHEARSDCLIFLKKFPSSARVPQVRRILAGSLAETGRLREAIREYERSGKTPGALYGKANTLQKMGMIREASQAYAAAAAVDARFPATSEETRYRLGENLRLSGDVGKARELLLTVNGERFRDLASISLGLIEIAQREADDASRRFQAVLSSKNRKAWRMAQLHLAEVQASAGKHREAAERLEELMAKYPFTREHDEALLALARIRSKAGDETGAMSLFAKICLRASPLRKEALDGIEAIVLSARERDAAEFVALWNAGGRWLMDPSRERVLETVADVLAGTGKPYFDLVRWLSRYGSGAVRVKALVSHASHCAKMGDMTCVRDSLASLRALQASWDDIVRVEAGLKYAEKDYRGAADTLLSLRKTEGQDAEMLAETLPYAGNRRKAAEVLETVVSRTDAAPHAMSRLADAMFEAGRKAEAVRYYRLALEKDPGNEWACYRLAILLERNGGEEFLDRIKTDPTLVRMAQVVRKEMVLNAR